MWSELADEDDWWGYEQENEECKKGEEEVQQQLLLEDVASSDDEDPFDNGWTFRTHYNDTKDRFRTTQSPIKTRLKNKLELEMNSEEELLERIKQYREESESLFRTQNMTLPVGGELEIRGFSNKYLNYSYYIEVIDKVKFGVSRSTGTIRIKSLLTNLDLRRIHHSWLRIEAIIINHIPRCECAALIPNNLKMCLTDAIIFYQMQGILSYDLKMRIIANIIEEGISLDDSVGALSSVEDAIKMILDKSEIDEKVIRRFSRLPPIKRSKVFSQLGYKSLEDVELAIRAAENHNLKATSDSHIVSDFLNQVISEPNVDYAEAYKLIPKEYIANSNDEVSRVGRELYNKMETGKNWRRFANPTDVSYAVSVLYFTQSLIAESASHQATVALSVILADLNDGVDDFTVKRPYIIDELNIIEDITQGLIPDKSEQGELTSISLLIKSSQSAEEMIGMVGYLKGTVGEVLLCGEMGVRYRQESNKLTLKEILIQYAGLDDYQMIVGMLLNKSIMGSKPDAYYSTFINEIDQDLKRTILEGLCDYKNPGVVVTSHDHSLALYELTSITKEPDDSEACLVLYEFSWVYEPSERVKGDSVSWEPFIHVCRKLKMPVILRCVSIRSSNSVFFQMNDNKTQLRNSIVSVFNRLKSCMTLTESIVRMSAESIWPIAKTFRQPDYHDPGPTEEQLKVVIDSVVKDLKMDYQYRSNDLINRINDELKREVFDTISNSRGVQDGVQYLSECIEKAAVKSRRVNRDLNSFDNIRGSYKNKLLESNYIGENFKTVKSYYDIVLKKVISNSCLVGPISGVRAATKLDKLLKFQVPNQTTGEKHLNRRLKNLKLNVARLKGLKLISLSDGSLMSTNNKKGNDDLEGCKTVTDVNKYLNSYFGETLELYSTEDSKDNIRVKLRGISNLVYGALDEDIPPEHHNSFRSEEVLDVIKGDHLLGKSEDRITKVMTSLLIDNTIKIERSEGCELPNEMNVSDKLSELFKSFLIKDQVTDSYKNWLVDILIGTEDVAKYFLSSGFISEYRRLFVEVIKIFSMISYFRELVKIMLICESFLKTYKRKKGGAVVSSRVRSTTLRLYVHKHRNYNESFNCALIDDKGTLEYSFNMNERHARLWFTLPKMILHHFISTNQELLFDKLISKSIDPMNLIKVDNYKTTAAEVHRRIRATVESFYLDDENQNDLWSVDDTLDEHVIEAKLIGSLLTGHFRHTGSAENNETASVIRYCIMSQVSNLSSLSGISEKIARKCRTGWDFIESLLIEDVIQNVLNRPKINKMKLCSRLYLAGFTFPSCPSEMVNSMYTMHMYPRGLGNWKAAVRKAHKSYMGVHIDYEKSSAGNEEKITGNQGLKNLFNVWSDGSLSNKSEAVIEGSRIISRLMHSNSNFPSWSSWVVELAVNAQKLNLERDVISSLMRCKELSAPITAIAEPTSVIEEMILGTSPAVLAGEYVMERNSRLKNMFSKSAKHKREDLDTSMSQIKDQLRRNPELMELYNSLEKNVINMSEDRLKAVYHEFNSKDLISDHRDESIVHLIKGVGKLIVRKFDNKLNGKNMKSECKKFLDKYMRGDSAELVTIDFLKELSSTNYWDDVEETMGSSLYVDVEEVEACSKVCKSLRQYFSEYIKDQKSNSGVIDIEMCQKVEELEKKLWDDHSDLLKRLLVRLIINCSISDLNLYLRFNPSERRFIMNNYNYDNEPMLMNRSLDDNEIKLVVISYFLSRSSYSTAMRQSMYHSIELSDLSKGVRSLYLSADANVLKRDFLTNVVEIITNRMSVIRVKLKTSSTRSLLKSPRCKSIEIFMEVMRTHNNTKLFEIGRNLGISEHVKYKFGLAPKDQFMGMRELAILEYNTKIMMAFVEGVSSHILRGISSDLLRNPKRKTIMLEHMSKHYNSDAFHKFFWSGDRTKWGPKHFYLVFFTMMRVMLSASPLKNVVLCILAKGLSKIIEIPQPSIESTLGRLMDVSGIKSESQGNITYWLSRFLGRLRSLSDKTWLYELINEPDYEEEGDGNISYWADDLILSVDDDILIRILKSYKMSKEQMFCLYHLSKGKISHIMLYHMNQGIPHLTSSLLGNSSFLLVTMVFDSWLNRTYPTKRSSIDVTYVTSSDDYALTLVADKTIVSKTDFDEMIEMLDKIQLVVANLCNIKDSSKSVAGDQVLEVYSVFNVMGQITPATIKFTSNSLMPPNQPTPLSMNEENLGRLQQIVDNGGTEMDICLWQMMRLSQTTGYLGLKQSELNILKRCSGLINYGVIVPYSNILLGNCDISLLLPTLKNLNDLKSTMNLSSNDLINFIKSEVRKSPGFIHNSDLLCSIVSLLLDDLIFGNEHELSDDRVSTGSKFKSSGFLRDPFPAPKSYKRVNNRIEETIERYGGEVKMDGELFPGQTKIISRAGLTNDLKIELARCGSAIKSNKLAVMLTDSNSNIMYSYLMRSYKNSLIKLKSAEVMMPDYTSWEFWQDPEITPDFKSKNRYKLLDIIFILTKMVSEGLNTENLVLKPNWMTGGPKVSDADRTIHMIKSAYKRMNSLIEVQFGSEGSSYRDVLGRPSRVAITNYENVHSYDYSIKSFSHYGVNPGKRTLSNQWPIVVCYILEDKTLSSGSIKIDNIDLIELDRSIVISSCGNPPSSDNKEMMKEWLFSVEQKFSEDRTAHRVTFCNSSDNKADWKQLHDMLDLNRVRGFIINTSGIKLDTSQITNYQESRIVNFVTLGGSVSVGNRNKYLNYFRYNLMEDPKGSGMSIITSFGRPSLSLNTGSNNIHKCIRVLLVERHAIREDVIHNGDMYISGSKCQFITDGNKLIYYIPESSQFFTNESSLKVLKPFLITFVALMQDKLSFKNDGLKILLRDTSFMSDETDLSIIRAGYDCKKLVETVKGEFIFTSVQVNEYAVRFYIKAIIEKATLKDEPSERLRQMESYRQVKLDRSGLCTKVTLSMREKLNILPMASIWSKLIVDEDDPYKQVVNRVIKSNPELNISYDEDKVKSSNSIPWYSVEEIADSPVLKEWFKTEYYSVSDWFSHLRLDKGANSIFNSTMQCLRVVTSSVRVREISIPAHLCCDLGSMIFKHRLESNSELRQNRVRRDFKELLTVTINLNCNPDYILLRLADFLFKMSDNYKSDVDDIKDEMTQKLTLDTAPVKRKSRQSSYDLKETLKSDRKYIRKMTREINYNVTKFFDVISDVHFHPDSEISSSHLSFKMSDVRMTDNILMIKNIVGSKTRLLELDKNIVNYDNERTLRISCDDLVKRYVRFFLISHNRLPNTKEDLTSRLIGSPNNSPASQSAELSDTEESIVTIDSRSTSVSSYTGATRFSDRDKENVVKMRGLNEDTVSEQSDFIKDFLDSVSKSSLNK